MHARVSQCSVLDMSEQSTRNPRERVFNLKTLRVPDLLQACETGWSGVGRDVNKHCQGICLLPLALPWPSTKAGWHVVIRCARDMHVPSALYRALQPCVKHSCRVIDKTFSGIQLWCLHTGSMRSSLRDTPGQQHFARDPVLGTDTGGVLSITLAADMIRISE